MPTSAAKLVRSVCPYCGIGCGLLLRQEKNKVVVFPQKNHVVSRGELCIKGATVEKIINNPLRLRKPLIRKNDKLVPATWDEALARVCKELTRIKETYGDAIGFFASAKCTNEENYLLQKLARFLGTNNIDNCTRLCHAPSLSGLQEELGRSAMSNSFSDLAESDCILIFGSNPAVTQPIGFKRLAECKKHSGKIITIDVRRTETAEKSDLFIQIAPASDALLAAGMTKIIIENGWENKSFIAKNTKGFEQFKNYLDRLSLEEISNITGASKEQITAIAESYAKAEKAAIINGMGVTQRATGVETVLAIASLALLTGNLGKPGSGINPLRGCNNVQGCCDVGCLPDLYPGYTQITEENIKKFEMLWKYKPLPIEKGLTQPEMIEAIPEKILGMYIIGENPAVSHPNTNDTKECLQNLEFLVVQEMFLTETARLADVVLPAACFAEKLGTITNTERRVQLLNKAISPQGCKTDLEIMLALAKKFGFKFATTPEKVFNEMRSAVPQYSGISYAMLATKSIQWPCDREAPQGTPILYKDNFFEKNKAVFYPVMQHKADRNRRRHFYHFALISHRSLEHYNTGSFTHKIDTLNKIKSEDFLEISKKDADALNIKDSETILVSSTHGKIKIKAKISERVPQGVVAIENHFAKTSPNFLTSSECDPVSKTPAFKSCRVRVEKI